MGNDNTLVIKINGSAKDFLDELDKVKKQTKSLEGVLTKTAKVSAMAFAAFAGSIALATKAFANYETALVGVGKTTDIEGKKLAAFGKEFQKLSSEIPISTNELLGIAQAAGQLGVSGEKNLLKFTTTIAKLGVATDLTGEQAATALTRILNVTNENIDTIDVFGSVIVALGNNFAASESEIVRMTNEVARSTTVFGVSSAEAAALGTALKSVGVQAQLGGSVVGKAMLKIQQSITKGGKSFKLLEKLTGQAGDQLKKSFRDDAAGVFQDFIEGLGEMEGGTAAMFEALEEFGLKGDEINKVLPVLAQNSELVGEAFATAAAETKNATALNKEAAKAFATLASTAQKTKNNFDNLLTVIGEQLAPSVTTLLKSVNGLLKSLSELDQETLSSIATFLKWGAIITGIVAGLATFALGALQLSGIIVALGAAFLPATIAASAFWIAVTGPIGIAVAGFALAAGGALALYSVLDKAKAPTGSLVEITDELDRINRKIKEIQENEKGMTVGDFAELGKLRQLRKELEKVRQAKIRASEDFGTGEMLVRPEMDNGPSLDFDLDLGGQKIPFKPEAEVKADDDRKKKLEADAALDKAATDKRVELAKEENQKLSRIQKARAEGRTKTEKDLAQKSLEINDELAEAKNIKDEEERNLTIENIKMLHADELKEIEEFEANKVEMEAERQEERMMLKEELRDMDKELMATLAEEDLEFLQEKLDTEAEAKKKMALDQAKKEIEARNLYRQDEIKHGTAIANMKKFFNTEEVQGVKSTSNQLMALQKSKNSTMKAVGKAAARVNAAIATAEGAIKAYTSLSGIPIIGPALGAVAAAAVVAFGVEQQSNISSAAQGGIVPGGAGASRDRTPMMLEPGELIVPKALVPNFMGEGGTTGTGDEGTGGGSTTEVIIGFADNAFDIIEENILERRSIGTGLL